ncbi:MAG: ABC transporter ATP-binding protein/permease [Phycisphaerales bacterium]|nr:ABC transporter ATP-binding protein/permease [Phycisphaerales bacterium]
MPDTHADLGDTTSQPRPSRSSKSRFRAFLDSRARIAKGDKAAAPREELDQNAPTRTKRSRGFWVLFSEFLTLTLGHRALIIACIGTVTISALVGLAVPASTKIALDYILTNNPGPSGLPEWIPTRDAKQLLWLLGAVLVVLAIISVSVGTWGRWQMTTLTHKTRAKVRRRVFAHAVRLPLTRVYDLKSGGAASILREDAGQAADLLFSMLYNPWRAVVQLVGTLIILAYTDWRLLVGATLLIPAAWFTQKTWIARIRPLHKAVRATRTTIDGHATEAFGGMRVVRGFVRQSAEGARFIRNNHLMSRQELLTWWWSRFIEMLWMVLLPAGSAAVLVYGGSRVLDGTLTLGDVMMFSAYLLMLLGPLESLSASATSIQAELASFDRILDLLSEPQEFAPTVAPVAGTILAATPRPRGEPITSARGHITFRNVSFAYPKRGPTDSEVEYALRDVDLDVRAGSTIALVGPSGAGKTTLCNLVARFYDPTSGTITIDGRDIRDFDPDTYRHLLGIVEQDVFLFDGTIAENIGYARIGGAVGGREPTLSDIRAAAKAANADAFIAKLEQGYDTLIGERGVRLSGGQKQRIAIARALLADPRILILDEATSNLDSESEALIQDSLRSLMRNRTCFVIAHRLSTIRHADLIAVIENGRIVERGTHAELVAKGATGRYFKMLQRQITSEAEKDQMLAEVRS